VIHAVAAFDGTIKREVRTFHPGFAGAGSDFLGRPVPEKR
jgi:hypothetical protein